MKRRLAAILAADMVGYSRLMGADEEGTIARQKAGRSELIDPEIAKHGGRIVKTTGDGLLVEFPSVVDAVRCAVQVQKAMARREAGVPEDRRIQYRVGINLGDIVIDGDDIYGDGVNVAARLEALAEPGGVSISGKVFEEVRNKLDLGFEDMGAQAVKNIAEPVHVWRLSLAAPSAFDELPALPGPPALPGKPSIAVLPFANMSGDEEQEYFADGVTEDVITTLSHVRWLFVIARNSSFAYKGQSPDIRQVAADLGVRYVLEGSVRKAGSRIRLTAQLIDGATGSHIWAERYDRELEDIFDLQDELTVTIAGAIEPAMGQAERARARAKRSENLGAWDLYQRGMSYLHKRTKGDLEAAQRLFARAIELDPNLVPAYSAAAEGCFFQIVDGSADSPQERREAGLRFARKAVELDNQDAGARYALGRVYTVRREHERAIPELQTAVELNPSFAWAHFALGFAYGTSGNPEKAIAPIEMAMRLSPHDSYKGQFMVHLGAAYLFMGKHEEALAWAEKSLREPNFRWSRYGLLICALGHLGRVDDAKLAIRALLEIRPEINVKFAGDWWPISDDRAREILLEGLRKAGLPE